MYISYSKTKFILSAGYISLYLLKNLGHCYQDRIGYQDRIEGLRVRHVIGIGKLVFINLVTYLNIEVISNRF